MDKMINPKKEKDSIYEIYRACRLCGGGAGYKMPIIQNIVELDGNDVELKQKIRDCVQIEVTQDDKMPPLICELCVDKVNDFYEFLEMCRQINTRTRLRLGLPPQALSRGTVDAGDCILGLTEPVFVEDSDSEAKTKKVGPKSKAKKDPVVKVKVESLQERRSSLTKKRDPTPPRTTRNKSKDDDLPLKSLKKENVEERSSRQRKKESTPPRITRNTSREDDITLDNIMTSPKTLIAAPKSILKKDSSYKKEEEKERSSHQRKKESTPPRITRNTSREDDITLDNIKTEEKSKTKRSFEKDATTETQPKKVKISLKPTTLKKPSSEASRSSKSGPKSKTKPTRSDQEKPKRESSPLPLVEPVCDVCGHSFKTVQARTSHWRTHTVGFTDPKLACNPCGEWFPTSKEAAAHHELHKTMPYSCENCYSDFKTLAGFDEHLLNNSCIPTYVAPDVKCDVCWYMFPTYTALYSHQCGGEDERPGGNCGRCEKYYSLHKNLVKHESTCTARRKGEPIVEPGVMERLKPVEIRLVRCDHLVKKKQQCDYDFGSDRYHPYRSQCRLKAGFRGMVKIHEEIRKAFCSQDYLNWESGGESGTDDEKPNSNTVHSLVALTLKTIFSQRLIGKVPRKKRRVKIDKVFDSLQADEEDLKVDISNIIEKLCADDDDIENNRNDDKNNCNDKNNDSDKLNDSANINDNEKSSNVNDKVDDYVSGNDLKVSPLKNNLSTDGKYNNTVLKGDNFNDFNVNDSSSGNFNDNGSKVNDSAKISDNDKVNDILSKTVESKTSLGLNDFSFDTI